MSESFVFPPIYVGMPVRVSFDAAFSLPILGFIWQKKNDAAAILVETADRGRKIYLHCKHREDPWLLEHPQWIADNTHALFELTDAEKDRLGLHGALAKIEDQGRKITDLQSELRAIKGLIGVSDSAEHRGPGRPRKSQLSELAEAVS